MEERTFGKTGGEIFHIKFRGTAELLTATVCFGAGSDSRCLIMRLTTASVTTTRPGFIHKVNPKNESAKVAHHRRKECGSQQKRGLATKTGPKKAA